MTAKILKTKKQQKKHTKQFFLILEGKIIYDGNVARQGSRNFQQKRTLNISTKKGCGSQMIVMIVKIFKKMKNIQSLFSISKGKLFKTARLPGGDHAIFNKRGPSLFQQKRGGGSQMTWAQSIGRLLRRMSVRRGEGERRGGHQ